MTVVRSSWRAFVVALAPMALLQAALILFGLAVTLSGSQPPVPDYILVVVVGRVAMDGAALVSGHMLLRLMGLGSRTAYGVMGGLAAAVAYTLAYRLGAGFATPNPGVALTSAIVPTAVGMIAGFLYAQFAGLETITSDRAPLAMRRRDITHPASYDGPVQVRTSFGAGAVAATLPAIIVSIIVIPFMTLAIGGPPHKWTNAESSSVLLALPAQIFFSALFAMILPAAIVVGATHMSARALKRSGALDYALIGSVMGGIGSLLLVVLVYWGAVLPLGFVVGAIMGAVYRRFAGIEPLPLPEAVLVGDIGDLVPEDHPSRRGHKVILNG